MTGARILVGLAAALALVSVAPMPVWELWLLRYAAIETRLLPVLLGLAGAALAWRLGAPRLAAVGVGAALLAGVPMLLAIRAAASLGDDLSLREYLFGFRAPAVQVDRDVALLEGRPDLVADVYRGGAPWVVVVHGGSWQRGDKGEVPQVSAAMAAAGITVFDLRYRLAPAHRFPAALEDALCAVGAIRARAAEFGLDPDRAALLGRSAGAQIALLAANPPEALAGTLACAAQDARVAAVIGIYGPFHLAWGFHHAFVPDVIEAQVNLRAYLGGSPEELPAVYAAASPNEHISARSPPALLIHGAADRLVRIQHGRFLDAAMQAAGRPVRRVEIPGAEHGFDVRPGGLGEQIARAEILRFLAEHLSSPLPPEPP